MKLLLVLIASHLCGDILVYSPHIAESKRRDSLPARMKAIAFHCFIHAFWVWLWLWSSENKLKLYASSYIFVSHFIIDLSRTYLEEALIDRNEFKIFKRKELLLWLIGKGDYRTNNFMKKHYRKWIFVNVIDQSLHLLVIISFALYATSNF